MRSADEVPAEYLVVDSGAFIKRAPLQDLGAHIYTVAEVLNELKCEKSRHLIETAPYEIIDRQPSVESIHILSDFAKKTGDYSALSAVDLKVLALAHDLHVEFCGKEYLKYDFKVGQSKSSASSANEEATEQAKADSDPSKIAGFYRPSKKCDEADDTGELSEENDDSDSDEDGWLDEGNISEACRLLGAVAVPENHMKVACITTDFAMQNVLLHLGLSLLSMDGFRIRRLNSYILRCRSCFSTTSIMTKRFCPKCGNDTLHRVAVTVNDDGSMQLHVNWQRLNSTKGLKFSLPAPKGGKHASAPQMFEDQRMPHNRVARVHDDPLNSSPFTMNDVNSRSAILGIRSLQRTSNRNPNAPRGGKKRGGKKR